MTSVIRQHNIIYRKNVRSCTVSNHHDDHTKRDLRCRLVYSFHADYLACNPPLTVMAHDKGCVTIINADTKTKQLFFCHTSKINSVIFINDHEFLTASDDGTARITDISGRNVLILPHDEAVKSACLTAENPARIMTCCDTKIKFWDATMSALTIKSDSNISHAACHEYLPLVAICTGSILRLWRIESDSVQPIFSLKYNLDLSACCFDDKMEVLAVANFQGVIDVINLQGQSLATWQAHTSYETLAAAISQMFFAEGQLVTVGTDNQSKIYKINVPNYALWYELLHAKKWLQLQTTITNWQSCHNNFHPKNIVSNLKAQGYLSTSEIMTLVLMLKRVSPLDSDNISRHSRHSWNELLTAEINDCISFHKSIVSGCLVTLSVDNVISILQKISAHELVTIVQSHKIDGAKLPDMTLKHWFQLDMKIRCRLLATIDRITNAASWIETDAVRLDAVSAEILALQMQNLLLFSDHEISIFRQYKIDGLMIYGLEHDAPNIRLDNEKVIHSIETLEKLRYDRMRPFRFNSNANPDIPESLLCPLSREPLTDPIWAMDGYAYQKWAINIWYENYHESPMTSEPWPLIITPHWQIDLDLKQIVSIFLQTKSKINF